MADEPDDEEGQDEEESPYFQNNAPAVKTVREPRQEQRPEPFATGQVEPPGGPGAGGPVIEQGGLPHGDERLRQQMLTSQQRQIFAQLPPAAQQHYALSQLELSRSESMQAQRLQNTLGAIEAYPGLTRGQKDDLVFQAKTKLNPLLVRQAHANEMKTQMQQQQLMQSMAQQAAIEKQNTAFHQMADANRVSRVPGGVLVQTAPGKYAYHPDKPEKEDKGESKTAAAEKEWRAEYHKASVSVDKELAAKAAAEKPKEGDKSEGGSMLSIAGDDKEKLIQKKLESLGLHKSIEDLRAAHGVKKDAAAPAPKTDGSPPPVGDKAAIQGKVQQNQTAAQQNASAKIADAQHNERVSAVERAGERAFKAGDKDAKGAANDLKPLLEAIEIRRVARKYPTAEQEALLKSHYSKLQKYMKE